MPLLIDTYCHAGGAAKGYHNAGFDIIGVDIEPQPNYPYEFVQADVLALDPEWLARADVIHGSPPCQFATAYQRRKGVAVGAVNLIPATRRLFQATRRPYVIENVDQAKVRACLRRPIRLCGSSFGLDVRRHRLFESNMPLMALPCDHSWQTPRFPPATNRTNLRSTVEVGVWRIPLEVQRKAMGIEWMTVSELSQAIPPAYTEHIGRQLIEFLKLPPVRAVDNYMTKRQALNNYQWRKAHWNHSRRGYGFTGEAYTVSYRNGDTEGVRVWDRV